MPINKYYYWDNSEKNKNDETLQECFDKYGTGIQNLNSFIMMECIYLDDKQDFGYSWMLRCYDIQTGKNVPVKLYEQHKVFGSHKLNPLKIKKTLNIRIK